MQHLNDEKRRHWSNIILGAVMLVALAALFSLVYFYIQPLKLVDIKVPVATDKPSYSPGQKVSGIFFGEVYFEGKVDVLREVYCKDYSAIIKTADGDDIFKGISVPMKLQGTSRYVGALPDDVPVGSNCVIQFANTYRVNTPFGDREETILYYTQNFSIITVEKRQQMECENQGRSDCVKYTSPDAIDGSRSGAVAPSVNNDQPFFEEDASRKNTETLKKSEEPVKPVTPELPKPAEPVTPPAAQPCTVKILGLCIKL